MAGGKAPAALALVASRREQAEEPPESAAEALLRETRPDELTPREALELVYRLKGVVPE